MKKKTYHHGELRQALIDTALELVTERGISEWSLREVARRIGVSHAAPYRHFADQESLLGAVAEKGFEQMGEYLAAALENTSLDSIKRLQAIGLAYVQYAIAHPAEYQVMFRYCRQGKDSAENWEQAANKTFMILVNVIQEGQEAGLLRLENPETLAQVAWSLVHGISMLFIDGRLCSSPEELTDLATHQMIEGIALVNQQSS